MGFCVCLVVCSAAIFLLYPLSQKKLCVLGWFWCSVCEIGFSCVCKRLEKEWNGLFWEFLVYRRAVSYCCSEKTLSLHEREFCDKHLCFSLVSEVDGERVCFYDLFSQFLDLQTVFPTNLNFKHPSSGHISTHRKHNKHWEVATSPFLPSYTSLT